MDQDNKKTFALDDDALEQVSGGTSTRTELTVCPKCGEKISDVPGIPEEYLGKVPVRMCIACDYAEY